MGSVDRPAWNLLTGTVTRYILLGVNIGLGIFLMPFTMRHLGQENYGLWMLAASLTAYFQLLDLGYGNGLVRQITQADARAREDEVNAAVSTFFVVYGAIGLATLAATAALAGVVIPRFPNLSAEQVRTGQWVLAILGARVAIGFPMSVFGAITTARQRFALTGSISIVAALAQGAATYLILKAGYGLVPLVAGTTAIGVVSYVAYVIAARRTFPAMRLSARLFSRRQVREVTAFSLYLFLISVAVQVGTNIDKLIIGAFVGTSAIAVYSVAVRLAEYQRQLCGQFSGLLFPLVVRFHERQETDALRATLLDGTRLGLALVAGLTLALIALGRDLVEIWMGPGFAESVVPLYVLALVGVVAVAQGPTGTILLGTGRHRLVAWTSIVEIVLNVAISVLLVRRLGLLGVAVGTAVPYATLNLLVLVPVACRSVGVPVSGLIRVAAVPTIVALVPAVLAAYALRATGPVDGVLALLTHGTLLGIVYVLAFWILGLNAADRARYLSSARRMRGGTLAHSVATP